MKRFAFLALGLGAACLARAATNLPPATALLLDERSAFDVTAALKQYESAPGLSGKLTSIGSGVTTILVNRWAAEFAVLNPEVQFDIHGGGTAEGLPALLAGKSDLMPSGRALSADQIESFKAKFGYAPAEIVVAQDAVGVYVNKMNPIAGLTLAQLEATYSRDPKGGGALPEFWRDLGVTGPLAAKQIDRVSLNRLSDHNLFFRDQVLRGEDYRFDVRFELVPSSLVQAAGADEGAICFASVMFATARTRFVPLQGRDGRYLLPSYENTLSGDYPLVRPMRIVFNLRPDGTMNPVALEFLRFAVSRRGQRIIALAGSYPITLEQQSEAWRLLAGPSRP
jgi:phosphate transport system substrate-binding protein